MTDLVSVIMPAYNCADFIEHSIESALAQNYPNVELIVVDDHSTDETWQTLQQYAADPRVKALRQSSNMGPAAARNRAIQHASGRYIAFLDSDDLWSPNKLSTQIGQMQANNWGFTYTTYKLIDAHGNRSGASGPLQPKVDYQTLLKGCLIQNSTAAYDTAITGGKVFCPDVRKRQDFGLFLKILKRVSHAHLVHTDEEPCDYRIMSNTVSSKKHRNIPHQWSIYREAEGFGPARSVYYMAHWFTFAALKWYRRQRN